MWREILAPARESAALRADVPVAGVHAAKGGDSGGVVLILDEAGESRIDDPATLAALKDVAYGADNRPTWIGAHRPATNDDSLNGMASWAATHYAFYLTFIREYVDKRGDILDIGCGAGQNTAMLARYALRATGIDKDEKAIAFATKHNGISGAQFIAGFFPEAIEGETYDYIFCVETMEHVAYDSQVALINAALAMLNPGGRMFITTPNEDTPSAPHVGVWSDKWMAEMAAKLGGRIVRARYFSNTRPADGFVAEKSTHRALVLA